MSDPSSKCKWLPMALNEILGGDPDASLDVGGIVSFDHVNLNTGSSSESVRAALAFYTNDLGLTRDPYRKNS